MWAKLTPSSVNEPPAQVAPLMGHTSEMIGASKVKMRQNVPIIVDISSIAALIPWPGDMSHRTAVPLSHDVDEQSIELMLLVGVRSCGTKFNPSIVSDMPKDVATLRSGHICVCTGAS
jgi:hypothetical protein